MTPFEPNPNDAYDGIECCTTCGREGCEDHLPAALPAKPNGSHARARPPRVARWARDLFTDPPPLETIEGVAWAGLITVVVSESGAGKTFVLLDVASAVSAGLSWHGRTTAQGTVAYCSFEGDAFGLRLRAMNLCGHRLDHLAIIRLSDPISPTVTRDGETTSPGEIRLRCEIEDLQTEIVTHHLPPLRLIVIDTIRASMVGSEDGSDHTSAYLRVARRLVATAAPEAAVILAHHAGWQDGETKKKRERGSSSWRGNVDATLYLEAGAYDKEAGTAALTLTTLKVRDSERLPPLHLIRRRIALNEMDRRGEPLTSCVIERDSRNREDIDIEAHAKSDLATREFDLKTLRVLADRTTQSTSQRQLRLLLGGGDRGNVCDSLSRLIQQGWVLLPEKQRQPYQVTTAGLAALNGGVTH